MTMSYLRKQMHTTNLNVSLDNCFAYHRCQEKFPEGNSKLSTHYPSKIE